MKVSDPPPACTACGDASVERKVSQTSFVLKGGGWYKDGYAGSSNKTAPGPSSAPSEPKSTPKGGSSGSSPSTSSASSGGSGGSGGGSGD